MKRLALVVLGIAASAAAQPTPRLPDGYRVETIGTPPGVAFGVGGLCFAADGSLFVSTREGQVWILDGGRWQLFADGLHEPLGIYVDPDTDRVFVVQRPELTELIDRNLDGVADHFVTVCATWGLTDNYHEYAYGLVRGVDGHFYGTLNTTLSWPGWAGSDRWDIGRVHDSKMGRAARYRGWSFRVTRDGEFEPWSSGLRSPCGIGVGPGGSILVTDNQGDWVATSSLHVVRRGRFHGHPSSLMDHPDYEGVDLNSIAVEEYDRRRTRPAVNFPHGDLANSPGEPVLDGTSGRFGPFAGQLFIGDQTRSNVFRVALDEVDGDYQGCAIEFCDHLQSGVVRSRFAPDGSLWVGQTGRGWGSRGPAQYGLQRIVWDGSTVPFAIHSVRLTDRGFDLRFTGTVNAEKAADPASYRVVRWRYLYHPEYGSPKIDQKEVAVDAARVAGDAMSVHLDLELRAGWMYQITVSVTGADGAKPRHHVVWYTLNRLRK